MSEKVLVVTGDREWRNEEPVRSILMAKRLDGYNVLVHGNCRGLDKMAGAIGKTLGYDVRPYDADWPRFGNGAGPIRNQEMIDKECPEECWGFHDNIAQSKGTKDMLSRCVSAGIPAYLVDAEGCVEEYTEVHR